MRIGIVTSYIPRTRIGGAQIQAWELAMELAKRHEVTVFTCRPDDAVRNEERINNVRLVYRHRLPKYLFPPMPFILHINGTVRTIINMADKLDILLCFTATPGGVIGNMVFRRTGIPYITSIRGRDWYKYENKLIGSQLLKISLSESFRVLVQTERIACDVSKRFPWCTPEIIPNGIYIEKEKANGNAVVYVGTLMKHKGVDILLKAMRKHLNIPVHLIGDGQERRKLESLVSGMDVTFHGRVEHQCVRDILLKKAKLVVLPSLFSEGLPNALIEALSIGIPVIASDVRGGIRDVLKNGDIGILVPPGDIDALSVAINRLWTNDEFYSNLSLAGIKSVKEYSWDRIVMLYERAFDSVLKSL